MSKTIILVGLSGSGKSTAGVLAARALGRPFIDTDVLVEQRAGRPIAALFVEEGEVAFRRLETEALAQAMEAEGAVVATGGGIVEQPENQPFFRDAAVIWLTGQPEKLAARLATYTDRPLLAGDALTALRSQLARRAQHYAAVSHWVVATDRLAPEDVAAEITRFVDTHPETGDGRLVVTTPGGRYEVVAGSGTLELLPERLTGLGIRGRTWIVSDDQVWPHHGERLLAILQRAGTTPLSCQIPAGEASKNLDIVSGVYDWLLENNVERRDVLLAFGGGVVGDLAGYVASTILRGIDLIQIPTNVLSMVDSSIGGKTGVDHRAGKNLIGTFYQPRLVLADTTLLRTLPEAERQAGL